MRQVKVAPANESPWAYLRGFMRMGPVTGSGPSVEPNKGGWHFSNYPLLRAAVEELRTAHAGCPTLLAFLLEILEDANDHAGTLAVLQELRDVDAVRTPYWEKREASLRQIIESPPAAAAVASDNVVTVEVKPGTFSLKGNSWEFSPAAS